MPLETVPGTNLTYHLIAFDAEAEERSHPKGLESERALDTLRQEPITDVFIFSHGWLGDIPSARKQYNNWLGAMASQRDDLEKMWQARSPFRPLLIGLHWPSKPWGVEELSDSETAFKPAGIAVNALIDRYADRIADTLKGRRALETIFAAAVSDLAPNHLPAAVRDAYRTLDEEAALGSDGEAGAPGRDREPFDPEAIFQASEMVAALTAGFRLDGLLAPLRTLSFWKMKDRARQVGETGGFQLLCRLQQAADPGVKFHLMGHSFGCIVASGTVAGAEAGPPPVHPVDSLVLVQGALSLWSYCAEIPVAPGRSGYYHRLIRDHRVSGPTVTTRSRYDIATGKFYPIGAGIRGQVDLAPGEFPKYGALGTFGVRGPGIEIVDRPMLPSDRPYAFEPGKVYNLEASEFISPTADSQDAHSNIYQKPEVAHAVWEAALGSPPSQI
ncbi:MAG: hypothetical protein ACP5D7_18990 [Limnospira sp.]